MEQDQTTAKIRILNDHFRRTGRGGRIMLTQGIQTLGQRRSLTFRAILWGAISLFNRRRD
jgi:hypothetical protein